MRVVRWFFLASCLSLLAAQGSDEAPSSPLDEILQEFSGHIVSVEEASSLLESAPDLIRATSSSGATALIEASKAGHTAVCRLLLERGAAVDALDHAGRSALVYATLCSNQGSSRHNICPEHLYHHPKDSHLSTMHVLLNADADASSMDSDGRTALHHAAVSGHVDVVSELLEHKQVHAHVTDSFGWTPLHHAAMHGHDEIVNALLNSLELKEYMNMPDDTATTPLMQACYFGHQHIVARLVEAGAELGLKNRDRKTAAQLAEERGHEAVKTLLSKHKSEL